MKINHRQSPAFLALCLMVPASADTIYSGLQDIPIPTTIGGVFLDVDAGTWSNTTFTGWDINPFFGGVAVGNSSAFQPARETTGNLANILNLAVGTPVAGDNAALHFASGAGGSQNHLALTSGNNKFVAGTEGYLGFKLGGNFGWMRVVFNGDNSANAVIKDWAYDNSGGAIVIGQVQQGSVNGTPTVTLSNNQGETLTLASPITGNTGVLKTGEGTTILTGTNSYSGATTVSGGILLANGSISGTGPVTVASNATLGGTGTITGAVTVNGGTLAPGASIESLTTGALTLERGSTFAYEMNSSVLPGVAADFLKVAGNVTLDSSLGNKVYLTLDDLAGQAAAFGVPTTLSLIEYTGASSGYFTYGETLLTDGKVFSDGHNTWKITYGDAFGGVNYAGEYNNSGSRFINLTNSFTSIPEPGSLLAAACLAGSGAFLRNRRRR